jgi:cytochrome c oxidase subunit 2
MERLKMTQKASLLLTIAMGICAAQALPQATGSAGETIEIKMTAKKYEFEPALITVKKGQRVRLIITALDRDHGFKLPAFNINQHLRKGDPATIEFTADKAGTFPFQCSVVCGLGHHKMKGAVTVEEH